MSVGVTAPAGAAFDGFHRSNHGASAPCTTSQSVVIGWIRIGKQSLRTVPDALSVTRPGICDSEFLYLLEKMALFMEASPARPPVQGSRLR